MAGGFDLVDRQGGAGAEAGPGWRGRNGGDFFDGSMDSQPQFAKGDLQGD